MEKARILRVTMTVEYYVPDYMGDLDKVIDEWFIRRGMGGWHATRDGSEIGNSRKFIEAKDVTEECIKEMELRNEQIRLQQT